MPAQRDVFRHVPWTCQWSEFGGALGAARNPSQASSHRARRWSPWKCLHPQVRPECGYLSEGDCDNCPFWMCPADRAPS